ncbi:spindle pole body component 110-like [Seriola lalandi dorsalis]|uniref:spindle pole body component 110-like n=1 Tax=Seriola lalandi dorsalis TaxID=1841481 RepID=UPI000C6F49B4|nr:spindle pole body component 110-like [Seriola lalandi dorsalis]
MLKAEGLLPHAANMDAFTQERRPIIRSCSLGDALTRSATFHSLTHTTDQKEEGSPRQRRITVASYMPQSKDQNGNFPEKDVDRQVAKSLGELSTDEVCQWFTNIGLEKCLPLIRGAKLRGTDIASVDVNTLDILHITTLEDREQLLSAIYNELHPPSTITQRLDSLLDSLGPNNVETFTATLVSMSKSKSSPHVSCLSMNRRSLKLRNNSNNIVQKSSQLIEITINASERIVHLRTPKETTVGKIMESCMKMLGTTEDKSLFTLKEKQGSSEELSPDQQIASLLTLTSENRQLELHLCKTEKPTTTASQNSPDVNSSNENGNINKNVQGNQPAKEERIRELNQQVDSLQNVILQVQELHHSLVAFCSELKNMDGDVNVDKLGPAELKQRLELVKGRLNDKRQNLQTLRGNINHSAAHKKKQLEVRLLEKMKLNCQVFKEEISMVHLNRQVAHLQNALQESKEKAQKKSVAIGSLSQLVSLQCPAMLLIVQENQGPDGHYGFECRYREGSGLVVVKVDNTHLCLDDRLVEVNGVPVVNSTQEELTALLLQGPSAQIVVLRQPPPTLTSQQDPLLLQHMVNPDPMQTICPERDVVTMETAPRRRVMAI